MSGTGNDYSKGQAQDTTTTHQTVRAPKAILSWVDLIIDCSTSPYPRKSEPAVLVEFSQVFLATAAVVMRKSTCERPLELEADIVLYPAQ